MTESIESAAVSAAKIEGDIVTRTLDTLNSGQFSGSGTKKSSGTNCMSDTYHLSNSVLSSAYQSKGAVVSVKG